MMQALKLPTDFVLSLQRDEDLKKSVTTVSKISILSRHIINHVSSHQHTCEGARNGPRPENRLYTTSNSQPSKYNIIIIAAVYLIIIVGNLHIKD